jgi:hypothetical protein
VSQWNPGGTQNTQSASFPHVAPRQRRSVDELAKEALKASHALAELARQKGAPKNSTPDGTRITEPVSGAANVFGSFHDPVRDNRVNQVVSEFSDQTISLDIPGNKTEGTQIPFLK